MILMSTVSCTWHCKRGMRERGILQPPKKQKHTKTQNSQKAETDVGGRRRRGGGGGKLSLCAQEY